MKSKLSEIIGSPSLVEAILPLVTKNHWHTDADQYLWNKIKEYYERFHTIPSLNVMTDMANDEKIDAVLKAGILRIITDSTTDAPQGDSKYYFDKLEKDKIKTDIAFYAGQDDWDKVIEVINESKRKDKVLPPLRKWSSFVEKPKEDKNNLIGNFFLERGQTIAIVGETGVGKSTSAVQIVTHLAVGKEALGFVGNGILKTLYLQCEDSEQDCAWQRNGATQFFDDKDKKLLEENAHIQQLIGVSGLEFVDALDYYCKQVQPDFVCINPILKFFDKDPLNTTDVNIFVSQVDKVIKKWNCGLLLMCHPKKPLAGDVRKPIESDYAIFGSQAWGAHVRDTSLLRKTGDPNDPFILQVGKRSSQLGWKDRYLIRSNDYTKPYWFPASDEVVAEMESRKEIKKHPLYVALQYVPFSPDHITIKTWALKSGISEKSLYRYKKMLMDKGDIESKRPDGCISDLFFRPLEDTQP